MSRARFVWACQSCDVPCFVHPVIREGPPPAPRAPRPQAEHRDSPDEAAPPTDHMSPTVNVRTGDDICISRDSPDGITAYHTTSRRTSRRVIRDAAVSRRFAKHVMRDVAVSRLVAHRISPLHALCHGMGCRAAVRLSASTTKPDHNAMQKCDLM